MRFEELKSDTAVLDLLEFHNSHSKYVVLDCEATSKNPRDAKLIDVQISGRSDEHVVIFSGDYAHLLTKLAPHIVIVGHSYKYDATLLFHHGIDLLPRCWRDTLLLGHLLDENRESNALDSYVKELWNDPYKEEFWNRNQTYQDAPKEEQVKYACKDVYYTNLLYQHQLKELKNSKIPDLLVQHTHRLQAVLLKTQIEGVEVDLDYMADLSVTLKSRIDLLKPEMRDACDFYCAIWEENEYEKEQAKRKTDKGKLGVIKPIFSFDSSRQLQYLLYGLLGLPEQRNEKTKAISVDESSLENLRETHPLVPKLLEYRGLQKTFTAFIEGTESRLQNGRIYPEFRVSGTKTGRISHSNPNLGQLPKSGGVRGIYRPSRGNCFISADYSQLEVCIEANLTRDDRLARIFKDGLSKHDITAAELSLDYRTAKTLNFALQYWASAFKVAKILNVSKEEGQQTWDRYWQLYAGCKDLKRQTDLHVDQGLDLQTCFGRRRRFEKRRRFAWDADYRQAYNFLIQGTGADITSRAFYLIAQELEAKGWGRGLFTVHDEILIEVKSDYVKESEKLLLDTMCSIGDEIGFHIPLRAESSGAMVRWED